MFVFSDLQIMGFLEEFDLSNVPDIPEYYKGKTLFITGGSGLYRIVVSIHYAILGFRV